MFLLHTESNSKHLPFIYYVSALYEAFLGKGANRCRLLFFVRLTNHNQGKGGIHASLNIKKHAISKYMWNRLCNNYVWLTEWKTK